MRKFVRGCVPSPAMAVALIALFVALTGSATAAVLITGKQIKDGSVTGRDIKNQSLTPADFRGSVRGAIGPAGPMGPAGPAGAAGPAGGFDPNKVTFRVGPEKPIPAFDITDLSVSCLAGEIAIAGGFFSTMGFPFSDHPSESDRAVWVVLVDNLDGSVAGEGQGYAVCARP